MGNPLETLLTEISYWAGDGNCSLLLEPDGIGGFRVKDRATGRTMAEFDDEARLVWVHATLLVFDVDPKLAERWDTIRVRKWQEKGSLAVDAPLEPAPPLPYETSPEPWETA